MKKYKNIISTVLVITLVSQANVFAKDSFEVQELQSNRQSIIKNFEENVDIKNINNSIKKEQFINKKVYNAPVKIIHAYEEGKLSMANGAIVSPAKLTYSGDKVTIELTFNGMTLYNMRGHLTNLFYYENNQAPSEDGKAVETSIIENWTDTGLDGKENEYPRVFSFTIDKDLFEKSDYLWCKVWVDAMDGIAGKGLGGGEQNAKIVIDKENKEEIKPELNKESLTSTIEEAKKIERGEKTDDAFNTLKEAIIVAEKVLEEATEQTQLDNATNALNNAVETFKNSKDKEESNFELVKFVKLEVEDGGPTDPKIRNILDDYGQIVKIDGKNYLRLTYFSVEKRSNGYDYGTKTLKYAYEEKSEKLETSVKIIERGKNSGEYELSQIDIPIDRKDEVYLFGEFMASPYNDNKILGKAIVRVKDSDISEKTFGNIDDFIVSQKGFAQKEPIEKRFEFDVEKDGNLYTPYTSSEEGKFKLINDGSGEVAIKIKRNSFLLNDIRHIKYTVDGLEPTKDSKEADLRTENKPAIGFDKYFVIYISYDNVERLKETGGNLEVNFKGYNKDFTKSTDTKKIIIPYSKESYDELDKVKDENNNISFKVDSNKAFCFNKTTELNVENITDPEILKTFDKLAKDEKLSDFVAYKLSFIDKENPANLDIKNSWNNDSFPLVKIKIEKDSADKSFYKNLAIYEIKNAKLIQVPFNNITKKASIKNQESYYLIGAKDYNTQLIEAKGHLNNNMSEIENNIKGNSKAEINLRNLLEKAKKDMQKISLEKSLILNYQMDYNFDLLKNSDNSDFQINQELAKELVKCISSDIYKEIFTKDFYNQVLEIKNELENKLQSGEDLKQDLLKLDDLFKNAKYTLPYKNISVEIKKQINDEQSMASGCFMKNGKILYGENENYILLNLQTMSPGFLNAHLTKLSIFKDGIDGEKLDVLSIYKYSDIMPGNSGKVGIFDKQLLIKLPKIDKDTFFIRVANDGMNGAAPGARLKITPTGDLIEDEVEKPKKELNKKDLTNTIEEAKKLEQGKKTEESFNILKEAIIEAEKVLKEATEQTQLDNATNTLNNAVENFKNSEDKKVNPTSEEKIMPKEESDSKIRTHSRTEKNKTNKSTDEKKKETKKIEIKNIEKSTINKNFNDTKDHWAKNSIDYVVEKGYFVGLSETEFGPNKSITRGQFVTVLGRMLNINISDYNTQNFKDVKASTYYSPYITWANKEGIVSGIGEGKFAPDKELTREEMAVMMTKFLKVSGKNLNAKGNENGFKDEKNIATWAKESVKEMARLGVVSGMEDGKFEPKSAFTRAQVAQVLYNIDHN